MNGSAGAGNSAVYSPKIKPLLMSFGEMRERFPDILICGPREVNEIFGACFLESRPALGHIEVANFISQTQVDFGESDPAIGVFLTIPLTLEEIMTEFGDSFYHANWVHSHRFSRIPMEPSVILVALGSNPAFRGRVWSEQIRIARSKKWDIISAPESIFTLLMADKLTGVRHRGPHKDRTSTVCLVPKQRAKGGAAIVRQHRKHVCVGEFSEVTGMRITVYGETALMDLGAAAAVVRRFEL